MTSGRSVENYHIEGFTILSRHIQKIGETVKSSYLSGAGTTHLLFHDLHHLRWKSGPNRSHRPINVFLGSLIGINFHRKQIRDARNRGDVMTNWLFKNIRQVRSWIRGDDQGAFTLVGVANSMGASHTGLANTTFAREENKLGAHLWTPFKFDLISVSVGYEPALMTLPRTTIMGSAAICRSRTKCITSGLFRNACG
jgi:hypothetical protein